MKRPSTLLILNLLVVHLFQGFVVFPFYAAKKTDITSYRARQIVCDGFRFTYMTSFYAAIMAVFLITLDRLIATCFVLRYRQIITKQRIAAMLVFKWIYVIALCLIPFKDNGDSKKNMILRDNKTVANNMTSSPLVKLSPECHYHQSQLWTILMLIINCALPYGLVIIFYFRILSSINIIQHRTERSRTCTSTSLVPYNGNLETRSHSLSPPCQRTVSLKDKEREQLHTITRTCVIIGISYLFLWLPSVIYYVIFRACPECFPENWEQTSEEQYVAFFMKFLAFLDATAAPFIYCVMSMEFRKQARHKRHEGDSYLTKSHYSAAQQNYQNY